jgi:ABC-type transport system involved in multi-copper enzyme maturation permease subunit
MRAQIVSEFRKLRTTRTTWGILSGMLGLVAVVIVAGLATAKAATLAVPLAASPMLAVPMSVVSVFVMILAIRSFTDEFRYGAIIPTLLATPDRRKVLAGKLVAVAVAAVAMAVAATALTLAIGLPWLAVKGIAIGASFEPLATWFAKLLLTDLLWAAFGVGLGLAVRHQVAAIVGSLVWITVGENLLSGIVPNVAKFLPSSAAQAIGSIGHNILSPAAGAAVFAGWTAVVVVIGHVLMRRRDIA